MPNGPKKTKSQEKMKMSLRSQEKKLSHSQNPLADSDLQYSDKRLPNSSNSTPSDPVPEGIKGTIKIVDDNKKVVFVIKGGDYEEFEKYKNVEQDGTTIDGEFYAGFALDGKQLYITGLYSSKTEEESSDILLSINSVGEQNGKCYGQLEGMKELLGLNNGEKEVKVKNLSKHPAIQSSKEKRTDLQTELGKDEDEQNKEVEDELKTVTQQPAEVEQLKEKDKGLEAEKALETENTIPKTLDDKVAGNTQANGELQSVSNVEEVKELKAAQQNDTSAQLEEKKEKITELESKLKAAEEGKNKALETQLAEAEEKKIKH
ncbi:hypothetical protein [Wolbachia endosymbiont (group A) of Anomoia purmunda]|uniref:hypothetical protein n=1 Tax=Wolbachia endosymbiont (group A) of Anomoia purmunda TaxID=2953978 RepID=UPI0022304D46|nr:hypothetical protein [Wolbachia endosymbiont (group A) of Anomoia purmunda]